MNDDAHGQRTIDQWQALIEPRLVAVRERIAGAGGDGVSLIAVSKGQPIEAVQAAVALGVVDLGENYAQELAAKAPVLEATHEAVQWHFIGQLQSNKVRIVAPWIALWQSVDRLRIGKEIIKRSKQPAVLIQVNLSSQEHKGGCTFDEVGPLVGELRKLGAEVRGLMGVGEADDSQTTATQFRRLRTWCDNLELDECSMGMSADLEVAIECGSTMVRIGADLFGPRGAQAL